MKVTVPLSWQSADGKYRVRISRRCVPRMVRLAVAHYPNEVGTPLVGHYSKDGRFAYVTSIAPLPPDSRGTRFSFIRGVIGLREFFEKLGQRFRGNRYRVGEWHSHPYAVPRPSVTDNRNQTELAGDARERLPEAILIILGGDAAKAPALGVFVYSRDRGQVELHPT
jgi:proteasome lid subunit RPN8/RPN11